MQAMMFVIAEDEMQQKQQHPPGNLRPHSFVRGIYKQERGLAQVPAQQQRQQQRRLSEESFIWGAAAGSLFGGAQKGL